MKPRTWYIFARVAGQWCIDWRGNMAARKGNEIFFAPVPFYHQYPAPYKE